MKFAKWVFILASIYGGIVLLPMYFREEEFGRDYPPAITHPEFFWRGRFFISSWGWIPNAIGP